MLIDNEQVLGQTLDGVEKIKGLAEKKNASISSIALIRKVTESIGKIGLGYRK